MTSWQRVKCLINNKYGQKEWFNETASYLIQRYSALEDRVLETFRYVACNSINANTFSYEYASILRDAGSVFGSVLDRLIRKTETTSKKLDIRDYRKWLMKLDIPRYRDKVGKIYSVSVDINYPLREKVLLPFFHFNDDAKRLDWWEAYNDLKHADIDKFYAGNLQNTLNSVGALTILLALFVDGGQGRLLVNPGFYEPEEYLESLLFFKTVIRK